MLNTEYSSYSSNANSISVVNGGESMNNFVSIEQIPLVLQVKDLQKVLSVSHNTAYALIRSGAIRSIRVGRKYIIPKDAVINYLSQN